MILASSTARTVSGNSGSVPTPAGLLGAVVQLDVTAAATEVSDTLNVYIQHSVDGTNYDDFISFTQVLGNGGAKRFSAQWSALYTPESEMHAVVDASLAAGGVLQGPLGNMWRANWVIVDAGGAAASFTFSVQASFVQAD